MSPDLLTSEGCAPPLPKPWPASAAWSESWLRPAELARRTNDVPLRRAWGVHILAVLLAVLVAANLVVQFDPGFENAMGQRWEWATAALSALMAIEAVFLTLACVLSPWGAQVEPLGRALGHALRRTWLQTPQWVLTLVIAGQFTTVLFRAHDSWIAAHSLEDFMKRAAPQPALPESPTLAERELWWKKVEALELAWWRSQPAYVYYRDEINALVCCAAGAWVLWGLLRAIGAPRPGLDSSPQPLCESCGYNVTGLPPQGCCPECGKPLSDALGRCGTAWQRRRAIGRMRGYLQSTWLADQYPGRLGRQLLLFDHSTDHRRLVIWHLLAAATVSVLGCLLLARAGNGRRLSADEMLDAGIAGAIFGASITLLALNLSAGLVGVFFALRHRRQVMPAAMQGACYLLPLLVVILAWCWISGAAVIADRMEIWGFAQALGLPSIPMQFLTWALPVIAWLVFYFSRLGKIAAAARFANR